MRTYLDILFFVMFLTVGIDLFGVTKTSIGTGNWNTPDTWSPSGVPLGGDDVTIVNGHTVTIDVTTASLGSLTIDGSLNVGAFSITVSGLTIVNGTVTFTSTTGTKTFADVIISGNWTSNVNETYSINELTFSNSTINGTGTGIFNVSSNFIVSNGTSNTINASTITVTGTTLVEGEIIIASATGTKTFNNDITIESTGSIYFSATETLTLSGVNTDLIMNPSSSISGSVAGVVSVGGAFTVNSGGTSTIGGISLTVTGISTIDGTIDINNSAGTKTFNNDIIINGTWINSGNESFTVTGNLINNGTVTSGTATYTMTGATKEIGGTNSISITTLSISGSYTLNTDLIVTTTLSGAGSLTIAANKNLTIGGSSAITTLDASANNNTVTYSSSSGSQTIKSIPYHNLIINKTGQTGTLGGEITVNGNLSILAGTLADGGYQINGNITGLFNLEAGTTLTIGNATSATVFPTLFTTENISLNATSTVNYNSSLSQTIASTPSSYGNLTLTSTLSITKTASTNHIISGNLTIGANNSFDDDGNTITVKGNITNSGTHSGTGKLLFTDGTATHTIPSGTFGNIEIDDATYGASFGSTTGTINGILTLTNGIFSIINTSGSKTFNEIINNSSWNNSVNETITITGNFQNNGTITSGTGTYTFSGTDKQFSGTSPITIDAVSISGTYTANNDITISTSLAGIGSLIIGANKTLNLGGTCTITTLDATANPNTVSYNRTIGAQTIKATTYHNLIIDKLGQTGTLGGATIVNGNLTINNGVLAVGAYVLQVKGNVINNASQTGTGNITFSEGTNTHNISGTGTFTKIILNDSYGITLLSNSIINGSTTLTDGILYLGNYDLTLGTAATIIGTPSATNMIVVNGTGQLKKIFNTGASSFTYPVGDVNGVAEYSPVTLSFTTNATSGAVGLKVTDSKHSANTESDNYLSRYWSLSAPDLTTYTYTAAFAYPLANVVGTNEVGFIAQRYDNGTSTWYGDISSSTNTLSHVFTTGSLTQATGMLDNSDFTSYQTTLYYWSKATGNWNSATVWEVTTTAVDPGVGGGTATSVTPTYENNNGITIRNANNITINSSAYTADQLTVETGGTLTLGANNLTIYNGTGTDLTVTGTLSATTGQIVANSTGIGITINGTLSTQNINGFSGSALTTINNTNSPVTTLNSGSTINYSLNGIQTISVSQAYKKLTISGGNTKTLAGAVSVDEDLTISAGTLDDAGFTLTVKGNIVNNGTHSGTGKIALTSGSLAHTISGTTSTFGNIQLNDILGATWTGTGNTTISGFLTITNGTLSLGAFSTSFNANGLTTIASTKTLSITSATGTHNFNDLTIVGIFTNSINEAVTISGNLTVNTTATFTSGTGIYTFSGIGKTIGGTKTAFTIASATISGSYTNNIITTGLTISTALAGTGTLIQGANSILNIGGTITLTNFDASTNTNTVKYTSTTAAQTIKGVAYHNLSIVKSSQVATLATAITINGNLTITSGTLACSIYQITGNPTGLLTMTGTSKLTLGLTTSATSVDFPTNFISSNISLASTTTVTYQSNGAQNISSEPDYGILTLSSGASTTTKTSLGNLTINKNLTLSTRANFNDGGYIITVKGNLSNAAIHSGTGKILLTNGTAIHTISSGTYGNIEIDDITYGASIGAVTITLNGILTITNGTLSITSTSGTKTINNIDITVNGTFTNAINESVTIRGMLRNEGVFSSGTGTYTFSTNSGSLEGSSQITFSGAVTITGISVTNNNTNINGVSVGNFTGTGGFVNPENATLILRGTCTITTLNASANNNTVKYISTTANQTIKGTTYHNLIIDKIGRVATFGGVSTVNGNLTVLNGTLADGGFAISGTLSGIFSIASGAIYTTTRIATQWFPTNMTITLDNNSTVNYNGTTGFTLPTTPASYGNLSFTGAIIKTISIPLTINGNLSINSGTLADGGNTLLVKGNVINNSTHSGTGKILLSGGSAQHTISGTGIYGNLELDDSNGAEITSAISISSNLTLTAGTLTSVAGNLNIAGNFTNNSDFIHNSGTVTFNGISQSISGTTGITIFNNLTINLGSQVDISSDNNITTSGTLTNNGILVLNSDALSTSTLIDNGIAGSGTFTSERYLVGGQAWYTSVPLSNGQGSIYGLDANNKMFYWNETLASNNWIAVANGDNLNTMTGYPFKSTTDKTINFTGNFNTGIYNKTLSRTASAVRPGWNLVGNPYPSAIDWDALALSKTNIYNNTFWIRSGAQFLTYNGNTGIGVPEGTTSKIPAHQAFWIIVDPAYASGSLDFTNSIRVHDNQNILKNTSAIDLDLLRVNVSKDGLTDQAAICFTETASTANDPYDSEKSLGDISIPQIYSLSSVNKTLAINTFPVVTTSSTIKLGYRTGVAGNYTISISDFSNIPNNINVLLEDVSLGVIQNMQKINNYTFNTSATTNNTRFKLIFDNNPLPVTLLNFSSECNIDKIELEWTTASESNNKGFIVEKSEDGYNFSAIGFINGNGNSSTLQNYKFTDSNNGIRYYRLKQIDYNDSYTYSNVIASNCGTKKEPHVFIDNNNQITITNINFNELVVSLTDIQGKTVFREYYPVQSNIITIPEMAMGVYLLNIINAENNFSKKIFFK